MAQLISTEGLVLSVIPWRETSIIARIFTRELGPKRYVINSVRTQAPRYPPGFFQSLAWLKMVVYNSHSKDVNRIKEVHLAQVWNTSAQDAAKTTILMFLGEVLEHCLRDEINQPTLFDFITSELNRFYKINQKEVVNFHIEFMVNLLPFLGFGLQDEGGILELSPNDLVAYHLPPITEEEEAALSSCLNLQNQLNINNEITLSTVGRRHLLKRLIAWYSFHLEGFGPIRSLDVLRTILE